MHFSSAQKLTGKKIAKGVGGGRLPKEWEEGQNEKTGGAAKACSIRSPACGLQPWL